MKIAASSAAFERALAAGDLTQLEWLDQCASDHEADGVLFDIRHFPRTDSDYLAQLKKMAADLGLTVAGLSASTPDTADIQTALALGAPLLVISAPAAPGQAEAWNDFLATMRPLAAAAKRANVTLALRNAPNTLCETVADCKRATKDVDSAWLRYALDVAALEASESSGTLNLKAVLAIHRITDLETFARDATEARTIVNALRGFRGFVAIEHRDANAERTAYHRAMRTLRAASAQAALETSDG